MPRVRDPESGPAAAHAGARLVMLALLAAFAGASALPASASYFVPEAPWRPKEGTLVRRYGSFHLFYTRGIPTAPFDSTWKDLGHAMSGNLFDWVELPPVLQPRETEWDNHQIWAPHLIEKDGVYYMFYTGVTHQMPGWNHHQRIGLATSTNLEYWSRLPDPVFECSDVPWTYCIPSVEGAGDFRDPFVMPDPDSAGHWLMYYTTRALNAPGRLLIGMARSTGDLTQWTDLGPMWNTTEIHTGSSIVESPDVLQHNGLWYIFYTTWNSHPIWFQNAASPTADSSGWSPQISLDSEVPYLHSDPSFGPEHLFVDGHDLYFHVNSLFDGIEFLEFRWKIPPHFLLAEPWVVEETSVTPDREAAHFGLRAIVSASGVRLVAEAPRALDAKLTLLDVGGRTVRELHDGPLAPGLTRFEWDGRAEAGFAVPSGVYFAVLETALGRRAARFVRLR